MTILVTGATGNIGRKVVDHLLARGATDVRALTLDPAKAALPDEVEVARGYLRRTDTLPAAFAGVDRMYLAPTPDTITDVLRLAADAGVRRVVDLSGEPDSWWGSVNNAVEDSGLAWTHLWPGDFMENARMWIRQIVETGGVSEPRPGSRSTPTAMTDIAEVAAVALLDDSHAGKAYPLPGPESLSRKDLLRSIGDALGRELEFRTASRDEAVAALAPTMGETAPWYVDNVLIGYADAAPAGSTIVEEITGRPATTFADWARTHVDLFR